MTIYALARTIANLAIALRHDDDFYALPDVALAEARTEVLRLLLDARADLTAAASEEAVPWE